jgi:hypothetical protein
MTNEQLLDLLREAKWYLTVAKKTLTLAGTEDVLARIDAALAERQDSAKDVVEWTKGASEDDYAYAQPSSDTYVTATRLDGQWQWSARRVQGCNGTCATEAEAKEAAIAAARGLR